MRTTLNIDSDVLKKAKRRAKAEKVSLGRIVSDLVRQAILADPATAKFLIR